MHIDDVAADFPDMTIIIAHPSWPWQDEALSVCLHKPNVYIDLSGWSPKYFPPQLVRYANTQLKHKMLFGSDFPLITPDRWMKDFKEAGFKPEVQPLILKENAIKARGLGLDTGRRPIDAAPHAGRWPARARWRRWRLWRTAERPSDRRRSWCMAAAATVGSRIVAEALARGHAVTVVDRDPKTPAGAASPKLKLVKGDAFDAADVGRNIVGKDVLVTAVAVRPTPTRDFYVRLVSAMVKAQRAYKARKVRLFVVGGASSLETGDGKRVVDTLPANMPEGIRNEVLSMVDALDGSTR